MCPTKMRLMGNDPDSPVELKREKGAHVLRDDASGYYRVLDRWEVARLARQATELTYYDIMCEGRIPERG